MNVSSIHFLRSVVICCVMLLDCESVVTLTAPTSSSLESVENVLLKLGHKGNDRNAKDVGLTDDVHEEHVDSVFCGEGRFE